MENVTFGKTCNNATLVSVIREWYAEHAESTVWLHFMEDNRNFVGRSNLGCRNERLD